jgi:ParB-like chromosome segregation protein Spo0J
VAEVPLTVPLVEATAPPIYIQVAWRARHLRELGLTQEAIGRDLGVSARTVARALRFRPKTAR